MSVEAVRGGPGPAAPVRGAGAGRLQAADPGDHRYAAGEPGGQGLGGH